MENEVSLFDLQVDQASNRYLSETARWAKFLAIVGFVVIGLLVICLLGLTTFSAVARSSSLGNTTMGTAITQVALLLLFALIYFFPCLYLYRFATRMRQALHINDQVTLTRAFSSLKSCFRFVGVLTLIMLVIYGLVFTSYIILAVGRARSGLH